MQRTMRGGALLVKTRQVLGCDSLQIKARFKQPIPPKIKVHSVAGHDEIKDAPNDSPEWEEYVRQTNEIDEKIKRAGIDFVYDYGMEAWSWDNGDTWIFDEPSDWEFPVVLLRHGITPSEHKRVDYIQHELLILNEDIAVFFSDVLGNTAPITDAEVDAASAGFRTDERRGTSARGKVKWYQRFKRTV